VRKGNLETRAPWCHINVWVCKSVRSEKIPYILDSFVPPLVGVVKWICPAITNNSVTLDNRAVP